MRIQLPCQVWVIIWTEGLDLTGKPYQLTAVFVATSEEDAVGEWMRISCHHRMRHIDKMVRIPDVSDVFVHDSLLEEAI